MLTVTPPPTTTCLLTRLYKVYALLLRERLQEVVEPRLQRRLWTTAVYCFLRYSMRRVMDFGESMQ
eukprot:5142228-Prorocentrum_lima.AAC.1